MASTQTSNATPSFRTNARIPYEGPETLNSGKWELVLDYSGMSAVALAQLAPLKTLLPTTLSGDNAELLSRRMENAWMESLNQVITKWTTEISKQSTDYAAVMIESTEITWTTLTVGNEAADPFKVQVPAQVVIRFTVHSLIVGIVLIIGFLVACNAIFPEATKATIRQVSTTVQDLFDGAGETLSKPIGALAVPAAIVAGVVLLIWLLR